MSDVKNGHVKHEVKLDRSEMSRQITPKILLPSYGQIICDFGHELRIVRFPLHDKNEWMNEDEWIVLLTLKKKLTG